MNRSVRVLALLCFVPAFALADSCTANIENIGSKLVGNQFFTQWRIDHDAGKEILATVHFEYKIHYLNKRRTTLVESGVFHELLRGAGKQYTKENRSMLDPIEIIYVDFDHIRCYK